MSKTCMIKVKKSTSIKKMSNGKQECPDGTACYYLNHPTHTRIFSHRQHYPISSQSCIMYKGKDYNGKHKKKFDIM